MGAAVEHIVNTGSVGVCSAIFLILGWSSIASAQVKPDRSLKRDFSRIEVQGSQTTIRGGANRGSALFHSFETFNVAEARRVVFANPKGIRAIFSRVTGSTPSHIDGTIGVKGPADLFLLNPNGIFFGPNAQLDLSGSFTASTSKSFKFDTFEFSAVDPYSVPLLKIRTPIGLQHGANAPNRVIQNQANLSLTPGQTLVFDAGIINQLGQIFIPGGTVELRSNTLNLIGNINTQASNNRFGTLRISSPDDLTIRPLASLNNFIVSEALKTSGVILESDRNLTLVGSLSSTSPAPLTLKAKRHLNLIPEPQSFIVLLGNLALQSGNDLKIETPLLINSRHPLPRLLLQAGDNIWLRGTPDVSEDGLLNVFFSGDNGSLEIRANSLNVTDVRITSTPKQSLLPIFSTAGAKGPSISVNIAENINLKNSLINASAGESQTAGNVMIESGDSIRLSKMSGVFSIPLGENNANTGHITLKAKDTVRLQSSLVLTQTSGNAGDVGITARDIILDGALGQSLIAAGTNEQSIGDAGNVTLKASKSIELIGNVPGPFIIADPQQLGIAGIIEQGFGQTTIQAAAFGLGRSGKIQVTTDRLRLRDGAIIGNTTGFFGNKGEAGDVIIHARDTQLKGFAILATGTIGNEDAGTLTINSDRISLSDGAGIGVSTVLGTGDSGDLKITTKDLSVSGGSAIAANSDGGGSGGLLDIDAQSITIAGTSFDGSVPSTLLTDIGPNSRGNGGELRIKTNTLNVLNGAQIRASTRGDQDAGNLNIQANFVNLQGQSPSGIPSTIEAQSTDTGAAGTLRLRSNILTINDRATITTQSRLGDGGDIRLTIADLVFLNQQGQISSTSGSDELPDTSGDGGNIDIEAGFIIAPPGANSDITANAVAGTGGNVTLHTQGLLGIDLRETLSLLNDITASSELGLDGTVTLQGVSDEIRPQPIELTAKLIEPEDQLITGCRLDTEANFMITGPGGGSAPPKEVLNQALIWEDPRTKDISETSGDLRSKFLKSAPSKTVQIAEASEWHVNPQGEIELIAHHPTPLTSYRCQNAS